jgi:hypothetical protein
MFVEAAISAIVWSAISIVISQAIGILLMWWLGLPPRKLIHEIEDVQNPAVGACFFILSLTASLWVGALASDGFTITESFLTGAGWIIGGLLVAAGFTALNFMIAHRLMGRLNNENVYRYLRREIIEEQNASLAFFMGGLAISPFLAVLFQVI